MEPCIPNGSLLASSTINKTKLKEKYGMNIDDGKAYSPYGPLNLKNIIEVSQDDETSSFGMLSWKDCNIIVQTSEY
jgi:hypothetical protein